MFSLRMCGYCVITIIMVVQTESLPVAANGKVRDFEIPEYLHDVFKRASSIDTGVPDGNVKHKRVDRQVAAALEALGPFSDKAMEIGGKLAEKTVDKLFDKIGESGARAADYLKNGASVDVEPQNGFLSNNLFAPPAWHVDAHVKSNDEPKAQSAQPAFVYPMGIGPIMYNGCWGTGYKPGDPCYQARVPSASTCINEIDAASFIGVGFDGRGEYSPDSRKMTIIQSECPGHSSFDGFAIPDAMEIHGVYETRSTMTTFKSREEYSSYLKQEAGVSGSYLFFSAGVTEAYGNAKMSNEQQFLSQLNIDVIRFELFQDDITADELSTTFLKEFMDLPTSYLAPGAPFKFQDFILRWGTHYIKSGFFGGRLSIRKVAQASYYSDVEEFSVEAKVDYDSFFSSFHAKSSTESGSTSAKQTSYSSLAIEALGGDANIAALVSDGGTPTTRTDLVNWLASIHDYPKLFKFRIAQITDLLYFRREEIFPTKDSEDCGERDDLQIDSRTEERYYYVEKTVQNVTVKERVYCDYESEQKFMRDLSNRRKSLEEAISVYMSEGLVSKDEVSIPGGSGNCEIDEFEHKKKSETPDWEYISSGKSFTLIFDMEDSITGGYHDRSIGKKAILTMHLFAGKWFIEDNDGRASLADGYSNGGSGNLENYKISIDGLVVTFIPEVHMVLLQDEDYNASIIPWKNLNEDLKGRYVARVEWPISLRNADAVEKIFMNGAVSSLPCNTHWSNVQTFDIMKGGICIYFSAVSDGSIYIVFASVPKDKTTWYYVEISPSVAAIHKNNHVLTETSNNNARGLGDKILHQNYFVCIDILAQEKTTLIEYGKYIYDEDSKVIYLSYKDTHDPLRPMFYAFGSGDKEVTIFHVDVPSRQPPTKAAQCGPGTVYDADNMMCTLDCDSQCDPTYGCVISESGAPSPNLCNECKTIKVNKGTTYECSSTCEIETITIDGKEICPCKWLDGKCVTECPSGTSIDPATSECISGCSDPPTISNGVMTGSTGQDFSQGSTVTYTCNDGFYQHGDATITCTHGDWAPYPPTCDLKPKDCSQPDPVKNGVLTGGISNGSVMTLSCKSSYDNPSGITSIKCYDGKWDHEFGTCVFFCIGRRCCSAEGHMCNRCV